MEVFRENQFIKWWWLSMFILAVILIIFGTAYYATRDAEEETAVIVSIISCIIGFPIVFSLLFLRLETRIDEKGISAYFRPFSFTRKFYPWENIKECYIRQYSPIAEYGGWGLRGFGSSPEAYNIWGNQGIQLITKDGTRFLIGTQRPKAARETIERYTSDSTK